MEPGRVDALRLADASHLMSVVELLLMGALCYGFGRVSGAVLVP